MRARIMLTVACVTGLAVSVLAGTEKVAYPADYQTKFVRYTVIDRHDRNIARFMYMNAEAWDAATSNQPLPDGAILVMEDHKVRMLDEETPVLDSTDNLIPSDEITNIFVMEKRAGWGVEYGEDMRNGEWEYAWFMADGARSERGTDGCFECHKSQEEDDYTFTAFPALSAQK